jgi:thioredoxin 1
MLMTNLTHIETEDDFNNVVNNNENVMICCGRMGPMCIPVYEIMEGLEKEEDYKHVKFADMDFDIPTAAIIRNLPQCSAFYGLPFTVYYKNGEVVKATTSIQSDDQVTEILNEVFKK